MGVFKRLKSWATLTAISVVSIHLSSAAFAAPGDLDVTFGKHGVASIVEPSPEATTAIAGYQRAFRYITKTAQWYYVAGWCLVARSGAPTIFDSSHCVARLSHDGEFDLSFGQDGWALAPTPVTGNNAAALTGLAVSPDGQILVSGTCNLKFCVSRLTTAGTVDHTFGTNGVHVYSLTTADNYSSGIFTRDDGSFHLTGRCFVPARNFCVTKHVSNGELDASFGADGTAYFALPGLSSSDTAPSALQPDGKIVIASACDGTFASDTCLVRFMQNGESDTSFGNGGVARVAMSAHFEGAAAVAVQIDGTILTAASCWDNDFSGYVECISRHSANGDLDDSFGLRGVTTFPKTFGWRLPTGIAVTSDGKIVTTAYCYVVSGLDQAEQPCVARYLPNGVLDPSFGIAGNVFVPLRGGTSWDLLTVFNDKVVVSGGCGGSVPYCVVGLKGGPYPASACTLNADANNTIAASSDAMLVTRYLLGFQGEALTNGAIDQNATRTADEIVTYLDSLKNDPTRKLDLDGDGESLAMTDGLLMLRAMLGLSGDALTVGAMGQTSAAFPTLRTPQQILQWIEATHGVACLP